MKPAPEGFVFNGSDDSGTCELPVELAGFSERIPATARNGCFQPQAEFDDLVNGIDGQARRGHAGGADRARIRRRRARGISVNAAIETAPDLLEDLAPVARTLAARSTQLERFVRALERTASAIAPVSTELAQSFANAAVAFEAISRDPAAVQATISNAVPLLGNGPARLARARSLLADTAELARRLEPGARDLAPTLPILNDAIEVGNPVLRAGAADRARPALDAPRARAPGRAAVDRDRPLGACATPSKTPFRSPSTSPRRRPSATTGTTRSRSSAST